MSEYGKFSISFTLSDPKDLKLYLKFKDARGKSALVKDLLEKYFEGVTVTASTFGQATNDEMIIDDSIGNDFI